MTLSAADWAAASASRTATPASDTALGLPFSAAGSESRATSAAASATLSGTVGRALERRLQHPAALLLLLVGVAGQLHGGRHLGVGLGVGGDEAGQLGAQLLGLRLDLGHVVLHRGVLLLAQREGGHHGHQAGAERADQGGHAAAARFGVGAGELVEVGLDAPLGVGLSLH